MTPETSSGLMMSKCLTWQSLHLFSGLASPSVRRVSFGNFGRKHEDDPILSDDDVAPSCPRLTQRLAAVLHEISLRS